MPAPILEVWRETGRRSAAEHGAWQAHRAALSASDRAEFDRVMAGELPPSWRKVLLDHSGAPSMSPRRPAAS